MADFPALPLWTDAYLADTTDLSAEEHGVYMLLLMAAWRSTNCTLPDDDDRLARMARVGTKKWKKIRPVMERFFTVGDHGWTQKRLRLERSRVEKSRNQKRQAANAKWRKNNKTDDAAVYTEKDADGCAESMQNGCNPYPYPYPSKDSSLCSESKDVVSVEKPPDQIRQAVDEFNEMAAECGLPQCQKLTDKRRRGIKARLADCDGIEGWRHALNQIRGSPFLLGENPRRWKANIDFVCQETSFAKVMEGSYGSTDDDGPEDYTGIFD